MNAFCGLIYFENRQISNPLFKAMLEALVMWKPDEKGVWQRSHVAMGQLVLHNAPESFYEQAPTVSQNERFVLVSDARLDNREDLAAQLGIGHFELQKTSDGALILSAYEKWGENVPKYLIGDFAFAIWDELTKTLFCARDHMGQRLLYYYLKPGKFLAFATTVGALLAIPDVPSELNEQKLADHLLLMCPDPEATFYKGILRLSPAHILKASEKELITSRYWSLSTQQIILKSNDEYVDAFKEVFNEAVRCRLRTAFPIGAHLSGGLDSSSVAAVAAMLLQRQGQSLEAFGSVPLADLKYENRQGWNNDDSYYMNSVAARWPNIHMHFVSDHDKNPFSDLERLYRFSEVPFLNPCNRTWVETILEQASKVGIRTMLVGVMGNATISWAGFDETSLLKKSYRWARAQLRLPERLWRQFVLQEMPWSRFSLIHPEFARVNNLGQRFREFSFQCPDKRCWMIFNGIIHDAQAAFASQSAVFGVEYRDPTHDRRVVEYCLSLPNGVFRNGRHNRLLIRHAMANTLPDEVRWRIDRGAQAADWFVRASRVREQMVHHAGAFSASGGLRRLFDVPKMQKMLANWPNTDIASFEDESTYRYKLLRGFFDAAFAAWIENRGRPHVL